LNLLSLLCKQIVIDSITEDSPLPVRAVKLLARYTVGENAEGIVQEIMAMTEDMTGGQDATVQLMAATILSREGNVVDAMKCCHTGLSLELNAMMVNLLCMIDRPELAEKQAKMMQAVDDDSTVVQLACAWANVASGGKKIQDASYIYQELGDKYMWTPKLHNGSAVCFMLMGAYDDAERELLEAIGKDAKNAETLANLATCAAHLGKSSSRFINAIKALGVPSEALAKIEGFEGDFARAAAAAANA
jgi:coatomer protein complex subunit epsilon